MNPRLTRRGLVASAAIGSVAAAAQAATPGGGQEPPALLGSVSGTNVTLPPLSPATEVLPTTRNLDPPARRLGVAVVGLGHLALQQILPGFGEAQHVRLVALVSGEADKAHAIAQQYGVAEAGLYDYSSFDRIRDNPEVDIVYVVLPNSLHRQYTERAAAAGKHVLCEKPMATSSADAAAMVEACRAADRKLMIAYRCQYEPTNRAALRLARSGELGSLRMIEAVNGQNNADNGQWRHIRALAGGGSLPDVGLYCLNAARFLTGEEPVEISASVTRPAGDPRFQEVEDVCAFTLRFPSGVIAQCSCAYSMHETRRLRVIGSTGWVDLDPAFAYDNLQLAIGRVADGVNARDERRYAAKNQFALEMDHFAEAIRANRTPRTPGEEGLQDMRLIEAIYQAAERQTPVRLAEVSGRDITRGALDLGQS